MTTRTMLTRTALAAAVAATVGPIHAASHREAPLTALDHKADITDFFAFVSYDDPSKVTMIMNVDPLLEPANGPNYFPFDPEIRYRINIDNDHDAKPDITYQFTFKTQIRKPGLFTGFAGIGNGINAPANSPAPVPPGTPILPPAITSLEGSGSAGLSLRQRYTVTQIKHRKGKDKEKVLGEKLVAVPSNVGPRTMPDYASLAQQGIRNIEKNTTVFAGTVDDPFWIDLGGAFDTLNFRAGGTGIPGVLDDFQDGKDDANFAADVLSGYNVNAVAIQVPIQQLTADGKLHDAGDPLATIGAWATTERPRTKKLAKKPGKDPHLSDKFVQIQRMANPLFNELIIGTGFKDQWSRSKPHKDTDFGAFALDPVIARVLNALYDDLVGPGALPIPGRPRADLLPLVLYAPPIAATGTPQGPVADLLRLNTGVAPTPAANRSRLGLLGGDPAGFPNGRRVSDDVTDIAARVVAGVLAGPPFNGFPHNRIGDGVNTNDVPYRETFPYLGLAHSGRDRRHIDPGEPGCYFGTCPF